MHETTGYMLVGYILVTIVLIGLIFVTMIGQGGRLTETRLVLLGIYLAIASVLYSALPGLGGMSIEYGPNGPANSMTLGPMSSALISTNPTGLLMRMAFVLMLTGIGLLVWSRLSAQVSAIPRKEPFHVD